MSPEDMVKLSRLVELPSNKPVLTVLTLGVASLHIEVTRAVEQSSYVAPYDQVFAMFMPVLILHPINVFISETSPSIVRKKWEPGVTNHRLHVVNFLRR